MAGACIHGSPSICIGKVFFVLSIISLHCAKRRPDLWFDIEEEEEGEKKNTEINKGEYYASKSTES